MQDKHLLILTGPQGSGNHVFSRVFSMHPDVQGWRELTRTYWVPSDQEPFAEYWINPHKLDVSDFDNGKYFLANVSCPFFYDGKRYVPKIREFADRASELGLKVTIAIVVRDQTINAVQQQRVGGEVTLVTALEYYDELILDSDHEVHFIDHEALFLWRERYVKYLGKLMNFPVLTDKAVMKFITNDANHKYVRSIDTHWLDDVIRAGRRPFDQRVEDHMRGNSEFHLEHDG
jgi:hypothetical protein